MGSYIRIARCLCASWASCINMRSLLRKHRNVYYVALWIISWQPHRHCHWGRLETTNFDGNVWFSNVTYIKILDISCSLADIVHFCVYIIQFLRFRRTVLRTLWQKKGWHGKMCRVDTPILKTCLRLWPTDIDRKLLLICTNNVKVMSLGFRLSTLIKRPTL